MTPTCKIDGCEEPKRKRGWCDKHYSRWRRKGDPGEATFPDRSVPPSQERVTKPDGEVGCWIWTGPTSPKGYGRLKADGRRWQAHRWFYEHFVGPIPGDLTIDHLCRNTTCVNPAHMEPVTRTENLARSTNLSAIAIRKNTCARGHAYTPENTYSVPSRPKSRRCRTCDRDRLLKLKAPLLRSE